jgi:hypothetical protein
LEVIDSTGTVRARIAVDPAATLGAKAYPETVSLRILDPSGRPFAALTVDPQGSSLALSGAGHTMHGYGATVTVDAQASRLVLADLDGKEARLEPHPPR